MKKDEYMMQMLHQLPKDKKIVITGATGFLGGALLNRLMTDGCTNIFIVGRNKKTLQKKMHPCVTTICGDLSDTQTAQTLCKDAYIIFHCAALSSQWGSYTQFYRCNVTATEQLATAALDNHVFRFVHVSSPSIYFNGDSRLNVKEAEGEQRHTFINYYTKTKYLAEKMIDTLQEQGLPAITIRPRGIYGIGDESILPRLIKTNERFIPLVHQGKIQMDLTYVENVVDALLCAAVADKKYIGNKYNITNHEPIDLIDLLQFTFPRLGEALRTREISYRILWILSYVSEWFGAYITQKEPSLTRYTLSLLSQSQTLCIEKAMEELHYFPRVSTREGIKIFARDYKRSRGTVSSSKE